MSKIFFAILFLLAFMSVLAGMDKRLESILAGARAIATAELIAIGLTIGNRNCIKTASIVFV